MTKSSRKKKVWFDILISDPYCPYFFEYRIKASDKFSIDSLAKRIKNIILNEEPPE